MKTSKLKKFNFIKSIAYLFFLFSLFYTSLGLSENKILKVGVALGDPFVILQNNEYSGIAIDIWKLLAEDLKLQYQLVSMGEHIDDAIKNLQEGKIDLLIGPIVPTYERNKLVDFTQPFYLNQIGLVAPLKEIDFWDALLTLLNKVTSSLLIIFFIVFIIYLHVFWYYERKTDKRVSNAYWPGIKETFWLHTLDVDLGLLPNHLHTRIVRFIWLIFLTLFFSSITAAITSALTVALSDQYINYNDVNDFKNKKIAAVVKTAPYHIAKETGLNLLAMNDREQAYQLVLTGKAVGLVDYYPIADYYLNQNQLTNKLMLTNIILKRDTFAFALPINSPLRHVLNLKLSEQQNVGAIKTICEKYLRGNAKSTLNCEI